MAVNEDFRMIFPMHGFSILYAKTEKYANSYTLSEFAQKLNEYEETLKGMGCTKTSISVNNDEYFTVYGERPATEAEISLEEQRRHNEKNSKRESALAEIAHCKNRIYDLENELKFRLKA